MTDHYPYNITLDFGHTKQMFIDRDQAANGGPPWVILMNGRRYAAWKFEIDGNSYSKGGLDQMLSPKGPAFWIESLARVRAYVHLTG